MKQIINKIKNDIYNFSSKKVQNIIEDFQKEFGYNTSKLVDAVNKDYERYNFKIRIDELEKIFEEENTKKILITENIDGKIIVDGIGTVVVIYNGRPEVTLAMIIKALKTHNKVILCDKNNLEINKTLVDMAKKVISKNDYYIDVINITDRYDDIYSSQEMIDKIIYIGNKCDYVELRKRLYIDTEYNGYGYIALFYDDSEKEKKVQNIQMYCLTNFFDIDVFYNDIDNAIAHINYLTYNETTVIFSRNKENLIKFMLNIKSDKIYINKNPLPDYKFNISDESLIQRKQII